MRVVPLLAVCGLGLLLSSSALADTPKAKGPKTAKGAPACVPGTQIECACIGGARGAQVCADDGARFEACQCEAPPAPPTATYYQPSGPSPAVPGYGLTEQPVYRRRTGLLATGITFAGLGAVGLAVGAATFVSGTNKNYYCGYDYSCYSYDDSGLKTAGGIAMAVGGTFLVLGIVFTAVGAKKVRVHPNMALTLPLGPTAQSPSIGATPGGLAFRF